MLDKFKEARQKRSMAPPMHNGPGAGNAMAPPSGPRPADRDTGARGASDYRSSRDDRYGGGRGGGERGSGYDRERSEHRGDSGYSSSRYE